MTLKDKVAIVTGASAGLGADFARALVGKGVHVYGTARRVAKLEALQAELGDHFHPVGGDVREPEQVAAAIQQVMDEQGRIDVLVNNAGLGQFGPIGEMSLEQWDVQMDTNLRGVFLFSKAVLPAMKAQNEASGFGGHIVNIASVAGLVGNPNLTGYNATKFGLRGFSEALMKEVRNDGVKVTCMYPGSIATEFGSVAGTTGAPNPMQSIDIARTLVHVLEAPDNYLISELMMRPLRPRG
ncbi:MAG: SDR family NAD(P)-dependent oxidoreductase [Bacteroidota bacterium]